MEIILYIILLAIALLVAYVRDRSIFWLLNFIKYSLTFLLPVILILYLVDLIKKNKSGFPFKFLILVDLLQLVYWWVIKRKYNWYENDEFYNDSRNSLISIPLIVYILSMFGVVLAIIAITRAYVL